MLKKLIFSIVISTMPLALAAQPIQQLDLVSNKLNQSVFNQLVAQSSKIEQLTNIANWSEGPLVLKDNSVIWSDITNNRVLKWDEAKGVSTWLFPAQFQNGHAMDHQGRILAASHGKRAIERLENDGRWQVLVDLYEDKKLNSPNDLIVDQQGEIWFTDPTFGIDKPEEGYGGNAVAGGKFSYRFNPETKEITRLITPQVKTPNGIALSKNQRVLYISDSEQVKDQQDGKEKTALVAYDLDAQKNLSNGRVISKISTGVADGIAVDENDNIWVTGGEYIHIVSPSGAAIGSIKFPSVVANIAFATLENGRKVAYVTGSESLYRIHVLVN